MSFASLDLSRTYTYADYLKWTFDERLELIKGKIFDMSPAPNSYHQRVLRSVFRLLANFLEDKQCEVFCAPFDVRLYRKSKKNEDILNVVQPDICVICDQKKIDQKGCLGAPDIVIEILSPGNNKKELDNKYEIYEEAGVKEYWIISAQDKTFFRYILHPDGKYVPSKLITSGDKVNTAILPGFTLKLSEIFKNYTID